MKNAFVAPMIAQLRLADVYAYDEPTIGSTKTARFTYRASTAGASNTFSFVVIDDNTHEYPNGENHPVVMANVLWTFFDPLRLP